MGLIWEILKAIASDSKSNDNNSRLEKEMNWYNLDEHEKEYVRKGDYEPYNFEDSEGEELDEDDFYHDK